ncbi:MAG: pyrroline-5-carboxylate reductase [Candidatus Poribacteria bacterium]|nr:pyrroline-5-carboxylate reductase [Candidatus Poribacteria bacterium]
MASNLRDHNIGFIGVGNMGESILRGALDGGVALAERIWVMDVRHDHAEAIAKRYGATAVRSLEQMFDAVEWAVFSAKPQNVPEVLAELKPHVGSDQWLLSIAAGVETKTLEAGLPDGTAVIRVMPNIAASVAASVTAICEGKSATATHVEAAETLFGAIGETVRVQEYLMDVVTGLSGSGPAFVFLVIEALADAGVQNGLTFDQAKLLATQTVLGSAKMLLEDGGHPARLKTLVTSPGGTTAAGLRELERGGLRAALANAVTAATERSKELGRKSG